MVFPGQGDFPLSVVAPFSVSLVVCVFVIGSFFESVSVVPVNSGVCRGEVSALESGGGVIAFSLFGVVWGGRAGLASR